ncbi:MAG: hypothetical protein WAW80_00220 [Candidatus Saccharimonadales bacterium]
MPSLTDRRNLVNGYDLTDELIHVRQFVYDEVSPHLIAHERHLVNAMGEFLLAHSEEANDKYVLMMFTIMLADVSEERIKALAFAVAEYGFRLYLSDVADDDLITHVNRLNDLSH